MFMHNFIKKIFGRSEPVSRSMALVAVPAWLAERERTAKATLVSCTGEPMNDIRNAIAQLQLIVNDIAGAEQDPEIHPKLKAIAKNSLPQFVRAMKGSLAKELPGDPEEFYTAAAECVKICLHTVSGQGRYLQGIFPAEMKGVRHGIDAIGRTINTLNPLLAAYRKEMADAASSRALFDAIVDLRTDYGKSDEKVRRIHARIAEVTERCAAIEKEQDALPRNPRMKEIDEQKAALLILTRKRDETARVYSTLSMTTSHVFRKAEKIATRQHHPTEIAGLRRAMEILSDHELPDRDMLNDVITAACPVAERMIASGEILLKNKEERSIFSDTHKFRSDICTACLELHAHEETCRQAEDALSSHPLLMKKNSLEREKAQLKTMLAKEKLTLSELEEWRSKTEKRIPELVEELRKKIAIISGDNVQLQMIDQTPS
jgi:HPt (histidine-containing phosphotransfer) domain-containing protein